jgi:hypothetical protein
MVNSKLNAIAVENFDSALKASEDSFLGYFKAYPLSLKIPMRFRDCPYIWEAALSQVMFRQNIQKLQNKYLLQDLIA